MITDAVLVADVRAAWASLSRACHHHHYELGPTAAELERWMLQTKRLVEVLRQARSPGA
jgi:3',5'-cyclic AMP phosphodiesterase CpdA